MQKIRRKGEVLTPLKTLTQKEHDHLKERGAADKKYWNLKEGDDADLVSKFREETKEHYYYRQSRMCCYCSKEFDEHKGSYDAEHVLDKDTYPQFMFEPENLAAACKTCNGVKSNQPVLANNTIPLAIPNLSDAYVIVHPHLDEWGEYLQFDSIGRITAKDAKPKGKETIRICGIGYLNAARLADHFLPADSKAAENALEGFFRVNSVGWKRKYLAILRKMADDYNLAQARAIINLLEEEMEEVANTATVLSLAGSESVSI